MNSVFNNFLLSIWFLLFFIIQNDQDQDNIKTTNHNIFPFYLNKKEMDDMMIQVTIVTILTILLLLLFAFPVFLTFLSLDLFMHTKTIHSFHNSFQLCVK